MMSLSKLKRMSLDFVHQQGWLHKLPSLNGHSLRILCYHGFSMIDEHEWEPFTFMSEDVFRGRLQLLKDGGFNVLPLSEALERLANQTLPPLATVITMDDGWYSSMSIGHKVLKEYGFPYTLYVSSYYCEHQEPVFNMALQYLLWKRTVQHIDLGKLSIPRTGLIHLQDRFNREALQSDLLRLAGSWSPEECTAFLHELSDALRIPREDWFDNRMFSYMNRDELETLAKEGVDLQLHTHRHCFPDDKEKIKREVEDNRAFLEPIVGKSLTHLCYPSGVYSEDKLSILRELGIESGTTCTSDWNQHTTDPLLLNRFVDAHHYSDGLLSAYLYDLLGTARNARQILNRLRPQTSS